MTLSSKARRGTLGDQTVEGDIDECQECGTEFNQAYGGYYVDNEDVGKDTHGGTAEVFRQNVEKSGNEWGGFKEEDIGPWCDSCSWIIQRRREIVEKSGDSTE